MGLDENILTIDGIEHKFIVNRQKLETLEVMSKSSITKMLENVSLGNLKMMFVMFIAIDRDKEKIYEQALEEHGFGGLYQFLTKQIEVQAGFLFR